MSHDQMRARPAASPFAPADAPAAVSTEAAAVPAGPGAAATTDPAVLAARAALLGETVAAPAPQVAPAPMAAPAPQAAHAPAAAPGPAAAPQPAHPLLAGLGRGLGLGLGVLVTEGLALVPGWNDPVLDKDGKPVASVPGAERIGDHDIRKRHQEVVGPQVARYAEGMRPGALHDLVAGFGAGASAAPGASYRLEAGLADLFSGQRAR